MPPASEEDELTFAGRRAREGAARKAIVAELVARGTSPDLAESVANGALADAGRRTEPRFGKVELLVGTLVLAVGGALFVARASALADGGTQMPFHLPTAVIFIGGAIFARGLFR